MKALDRHIEAILFYFAEPKSVVELARMLKTSDVEIREALGRIRVALEGRGVRLVETGDEVALASAPESSQIIETLVKEEREKDLGKAGLETLSIVLYHAPVTRSDIDHIRGVNSTFIVRNLLIRGLVEKVPNPKDQRSFHYLPTLDLLRFLGVSRVEDLPSFEETKAQLEAFMTQSFEEADSVEKGVTVPTIEAGDAETGKDASV